MDLLLLKLAIERLNQQLEELKQENKNQHQRIVILEKGSSKEVRHEPMPPVKDTELLTNMEVRALLRIGKNTMIKLTKTGQIQQIRMNERTLRYSKISVLEYIERSKIQM